MATKEPKKRSVVATLVENKLTEREDDFTANITYVGRRSINDLCSIAAKQNGKYSASELYAAYDILKTQAKEEMYSGATVEFGLAYNALGVDGPLISRSAQFNRAVNSLVVRCTPLAELRPELDLIDVIINGVKDGLPTIGTLTDVGSKTVNQRITPGNTLNGKGDRVKIVGTEDNTVGFFFIDSTDETKVVPVPENVLSRNEPSNFSFIIPALADGTYYLEIATQYGGNSKTLLKDVRRSRFPYLLTVGDSGGGGEDDRPEIE